MHTLQSLSHILTLTHRSKNLIYTVVYIHEDGKISDEIIEHDNNNNNSVLSPTNMAYGTNCPVLIDSKYDGIVLLPERGGGTKTFHYTVMIHMTGGQSRYEFGVEAHRIKYRKVVSPTVAMGEEMLLQDDDAAAVVAVVATPNHAATVTHAVPPTIIGEAKAVVPSSITVEADNNKRKRDEMDESPLTITPPIRNNSHQNNTAQSTTTTTDVARSIDEDLHQHETHCSNVPSEGVNDNMIVITIPEWIQQNQAYRRRDLFCKLKTLVLH
jgi:hypothetical protein